MQAVYTCALGQEKACFVPCCYTALTNETRKCLYCTSCCIQSFVLPHPFPVQRFNAGHLARLLLPGSLGPPTHRTFAFPRVVPWPSELVLATLPRPLGVVLEWDDRHKRVVVAELVEGSNAQQKSKVKQRGVPVVMQEKFRMRRAVSLKDEPER